MAIEGNATPPMEQIGGVHRQKILSVVDRESDTPAAVISVHVKMNVTIEDHEETFHHQAEHSADSESAPGSSADEGRNVGVKDKKLEERMSG